MSVLTPTTGSVIQIPPYPIYKLSVDNYHRMIQTGILTEDDPVELLEGWIVHKMPRNPPHDGTIQVANEVLGVCLPVGWRIRIQSAITTTDSEPEPDLTIVRGDARTYLIRHPEPQDIATLIEVAGTSLSQDRIDKGRLYARAGIPFYWIINLVDRRIEVYNDPTGPDPNPRYRQRHDYGVQDAVPLVIDGRILGPIRVSDLLP